MHKRPRLLVLLALLFTLPALAQQTPPAQRLAWYDAHVALKAQSPFRHLAWQPLGPTNISGRMTDVAVVQPRGKNYTIYVAGASGGVWKTVNEGTTWEPVFEHGPSTAIGDVTLDPTNPDVVWIGTGEANIFRSSMAGAGVFKSTDAGKTWRHMGLAGTHTISRIVINPQDPQTVYVAASGHEWTPNEDRGVYKTTDGGETWRKVHYIDENTGAIDLVMDPSNPNTLYAATWQRVREKWNDPRNEPYYAGSAIYKTTDGGETWNEITKGLPEARHRGRIGLDVSASNPNIVYAFVDNYETLREAGEEETDAYGRPRGPVIKGATVFRSDDGGANWRQTSEANQYMERLSGTYGWVFGQLRVDPTNPDKIYVMGLALNVSEDGGKTFRRLRGMHGDHHGLWIDPANPDYLVNVNDGGVAVSYDSGENWRTFYDNLPLVQFFNVSYDMDTPFHVYGSIQDHGSRRGVVDLSGGRQAIPAVEWENAPGGEGSRHAADPTDPNTLYSAGFYGTISRTDLAADERADIMPERVEPERSLRGQWLAPFILSPHNPRILYHGMNYLFRSLNRGDAWERISPDLTHNDLSQLGDIPYQTIFAVSESPLKFGLLYAGTDDGRIHVTKDHGDTWTELTARLPYKKWVSKIAASAYDEATVYLAQNGKRDDDFTPYLWKSTDYGQTWTSLAAGIPSGPINVVTEDPKNPSVLYVGTDLGAYVSLDGGQAWHSLAGDFPTTFVHDLVVHSREDILVAATHGRGMYAMDVRPIQQMTAEVLAKALHVFPAEPARLPAGFRQPALEAHVFYYLKNSGNATVQVQDESGKVVKTLEATADAGLNVTVWDLTGAGENARNVEPGTYKIVITAANTSAETPVEVRQ